MDDNHLTSPSLVKAYNFHSFNPDYEPNIFQPDGLSPVTSPVANTRKPNGDGSFYFAIFVLVVLIALLAHRYVTAAQPDNFLLSPIAVLVSALLAFIGVHKSIKNNKLMSTENNAISAIKALWKQADVESIKRKDEAEYIVKKSPSFHRAINDYRKLQKKLLASYDEEETQSQQLSVALLGSYFAAGDFDDLEPYLQDTKAFWKETREKHKLDRQTIRKGLNQAEKLCQSIYLGVYDENTIRNQIGADLSGVCTYLLTYIYAHREIHALRLMSRKDVLEGIPFVEKGTPYRAQAESHDLLYEYLEYFIYKWFYTDKPTSFEHFHSHVLAVYKDIDNFMGRTEGQGVFPPFLQLTINHQQDLMSALKSLD